MSKKPQPPAKNSKAAKEAPEKVPAKAAKAPEKATAKAAPAPAKAAHPGAVPVPKSSAVMAEGDAHIVKSFTGRKRIRKNFGRIPEVTRMPNLIEVQRSSYDHFLQMDVPAEKRGN